MPDIEDDLKQVEARDDLARFVSALPDDLIQNPEEWGSLTLAAYLDSLGRWIEDTANPKAANYPIARALEWRTFGEMLLAAKFYE